MTATVLPFARRNPDGAQEKAEVARTTGEIERRAFIRELREALASRVGKVKLLRKLRRDEDAFDQVAKSGNTKAFDLLRAMRDFLSKRKRR